MDIQQFVADKFLASHPEDAARILEKLPVALAASQLDQFSPALIAEVVNRMSIVFATQIIGQMSPVQAALVVTQLSSGFSAIMLRRIGEVQSESILANMKHDSGAKLRRILKYPKETAGALTDFDVFTLLDEFTAKEAMDEARKHAYLKHYLYVLNRDKQLVGVLNLSELFTAEPDKRVSRLMNKNVLKLFAYEPLESVFVNPDWLHHYVLPVVEEGDLFLGVMPLNTLRKLELEKLDIKESSDLSKAGAALGELYQIGLHGLLQSAMPQNELPKKP